MNFLPRRSHSDTADLGTAALATRTLLLAAPLLTLHLPGHGWSLSLAPALYLAYRDWHSVVIDPLLKRLALATLAWLLLFTLLSTDPARSAKGAFDMLRGMLFFFPGLLLARLLLAHRLPGRLLNLAALGLIVASFAYDRGDFFGFHENPNNVAVGLVVYLLFSLPFDPPARGQRAWWLINAAALGLGGWLLVAANSRNTWLALGIAAAGFLLTRPRLPRSARHAGLALLLLGLAGLLLWFNSKGFSLSERPIIWMGLLETTLAQRPWLGYGINVVKDVMTAQGLPTLTAHNLFLEVFVSTGILGLVLFLILLAAWLRLLWRWDYRDGSVFRIGAAGLIIFFCMSQFDLKLASFRLIAMLSLLLAFVYATRHRPAGTTVLADNPLFRA